MCLLSKVGGRSSWDRSSNSGLRPSNENRKVRPAKSAGRRYLTEREVERLLEAARKSGRYGDRDAALILLGFRHGFRVSRTGRAPVVAGGPSGGPPARPEGQERDALRSPAHRPRATRSPRPTASGTGLAVRVQHRARGGDDHRQRPEGLWRVQRRKPGLRGRRSNPHALRHACGFSPRQPGHRHPHRSSVSRAPLDPAYGQVHGACAGPVQGPVRRLTDTGRASP